jgi:hypothetical protein
MRDTHKHRCAGRHEGICPQPGDSLVPLALCTDDRAKKESGQKIYNEVVPCHKNLPCA